MYLLINIFQKYNDEYSWFAYLLFITDQTNMFLKSAVFERGLKSVAHRGEGAEHPSDFYLNKKIH